MPRAHRRAAGRYRRWWPDSYQAWNTQVYASERFHTIRGPDQRIGPPGMRLEFSPDRIDRRTHAAWWELAREMSKRELIDQEIGRLSDTDLDRLLELLHTLTEEPSEASISATRHSRLRRRQTMPGQPHTPPSEVGTACVGRSAMALSTATCFLFPVVSCDRSVLADLVEYRPMAPAADLC